MQKVFFRSKDKTSIKVGTTAEDAKWYKMSGPVQAFVGKIPSVNGKEVQEMKEEGGEIKLIKFAFVKKQFTPGGGSFRSPMSPKEQDNITRGCAMNSASTAVCALQGKLASATDVAKATIAIFEALYAKLKSYSTPAAVEPVVEPEPEVEGAVESEEPTDVMELE